MKFSRNLAAVSATALLVGATGASAAGLQLENIGVEWTNVVAPLGADPLIQNGARGSGDSSFVVWGDPAGGGQTFLDPIGDRSGYELDIISDPVPDPAVEPNSGAFDFGTFTHFNNPIFTAITSVDLVLTTDVTLDGILIVEDATFLFTFNHNETPNNCDTIANPGCDDDIVSVTLLNDTSTVEVDGVLYTLNFLGFLQDGVLNEEFISPEGGSSPGIIQAEFTSSIPGVPLPAAGWLLLAGMGGLAAASRKKKKRPDA